MVVVCCVMLLNRGQAYAGSLKTILGGIAGGIFEYIWGGDSTCITRASEINTKLAELKKDKKEDTEAEIMFATELRDMSMEIARERMEPFYRRCIRSLRNSFCCCFGTKRAPVFGVTPAPQREFQSLFL